MKTLFLVIASLFVTALVHAQSPVRWTIDAKKIADTLYELHIKADVTESWHIYSQFTPAGGPKPTKIIFTKNPLIKILGSIKENGNMQKKFEDVFNVDVKYFEGSVTFVQVIKVKANVKTNVSGSIEYMVCTDKQCLPPAKTPFTVALK